MTISPDKLKSVIEKTLKNKDILIFLGVCGLLILVVSATFSTAPKQMVKESEQNQQEEKYEEVVEKKLEKILKEIDPTKNVSVMITFDDCYEYVVATETRKNVRSEKQEENKISTEEEVDSKVVLVQQGNESKPFIVKKIYPKVRGVAIVSEGAREKKVYIGLIKATSAVLGITPDKVEVFIK
ncbi:hypothetical protein ELD05_05495 [Caldicellulosiruptor changbaiensis]|uniref:Stage III sporulation protein AG n=1 Tax=Caldicellulosiruptor changbaiensis TaxID=1222016 RepID=A0A3T0D4Z7_9FIRM|nr:hypothetical protein [Caldicellulosiruptor changbaiensis]AZT90141.1 hypothetical protein ELD05_05495 [Caldicellulosiruptor changbaiensis]